MDIFSQMVPNSKWHSMSARGSVRSALTRSSSPGLLRRLSIARDRYIDESSCLVEYALWYILRFYIKYETEEREACVGRIEGQTGEVSAPIS